jgi:hypothetical protein
MRLHSLKHEKRKKTILNSKWRQNPRWMPKFVFDILPTEFRLFQNTFLRSFYFAIAKLLKKYERENLRWMPKFVFYILSTEFRFFSVTPSRGNSQNAATQRVRRTNNVAASSIV